MEVLLNSFHLNGHTLDYECYLKTLFTLCTSSGPTPSPGMSVTMYRPLDCVSGSFFEAVLNDLDFPKAAGSS